MSRFRGPVCYGFSGSDPRGAVCRFYGLTSEQVRERGLGPE